MVMANAFSKTIIGNCYDSQSYSPSSRFSSSFSLMSTHHAAYHQTSYSHAHTLLPVPWRAALPPISHLSTFAASTSKHYPGRGACPQTVLQDMCTHGRMYSMYPNTCMWLREPKISAHARTCFSQPLSRPWPLQSTVAHKTQLLAQRTLVLKLHMSACDHCAPSVCSTA